MEGLNGTVEALHSKVDQLNGKIDLVNQQLIELRVRVELQGESLRNMRDHGEEIARLGTYVRISWGVICILLGIGATVMGRVILQ